jgi:FMN phosphatase YigB (HAD superfamily)
LAASRFQCILFDWGGTLMSEEGPVHVPMELWPEVRAIEGAKETLAALAPHHRLAIATNATVSKRDMIERALARVSLLDYISDIFCFTEIGARKDSRAFWSRVCADLKVGPSALAMVGDTLDQDVIAPREYGVFSVWFNENRRSDLDAEGVPTIYRLPDLVPLLTNAS